MSRSAFIIVIAFSMSSVGALAPGAAHATKRADAIRRCNDQMGCKVIYERNGDVVIIVDDVDGDGRGGGVIHCPSNSGNCSPMRKQQQTKPKAPHREGTAVLR